MVHSLWHVIRRNLARVPMDIRREWTSTDVERWWEAVRKFTEFQDYRDVSFSMASRYCAGLYGERATSDPTAVVHIQ